MAPAPAAKRPAQQLLGRAFYLQMAERGGFEPPNPVSRINGFRDRRIQPLCHLSARRRLLHEQEAADA